MFCETGIPFHYIFYYAKNSYWCSSPSYLVVALVGTHASPSTTTSAWRCAGTTRRLSSVPSLHCPSTVVAWRACSLKSTSQARGRAPKTGFEF